MGKWRYLLGLVLICLAFSSYYGRISGRDKISKFPMAKMDDCPVIDSSLISKKATPCEEALGSITGLTATGTAKLFYTWRNSSGTVVGNTINLVNIPAGTYTLEVTDGSVCGKAYSRPIIIPEINGVTIDITNLKVTLAGCKNDGALTGINITGATHIEWRIFGTSTVVGTSTDLTNVSTGTYELYASNNSCNKQAGPFIISSATQVPAIQHVAIKNPTCNKKNGSINVTLLVSQTQPRIEFYWEDSTQNVIANGVILAGELNPVLPLTGLSGGDYYLYAVSSDRCFILLGKYTLRFPNVQIVLDSAYLVPDRCNEHVGYMQAYVIGGTPGPGSQYLWRDSTGKLISTYKYARNLGAGTYTLHYIDSQGCIADASFSLTNNSPTVTPPLADGTTLCLPGIAAIAVKNVDTGIYRLYASITDTIPIDTSVRGLFYKNIKHTTDFYVAHGRGDCESTRTKVTITVVADLTIPNAFTPNNDGVNDVWNIAGIDKYPGATIDIFNRQGQLVYHSLNYSRAFNGIYNSQPLPVGVYYYIIDVKVPVCFGKISGSLTIIR